MPITYEQDTSGQWWGRWRGPQGNGWRSRANVIKCIATGCGKQFPRLPWIGTKSRSGPFCSTSCKSKSQLNHRGAHKGEAHHFWRGGRQIIDGYVYLYRPDHPTANSNGFIAEHRLIMESAIGRLLRPEETVHHKYGVRDDNDPDRLELWSSNHPKGQRVEDLVRWAREILALYDVPAGGAPLPREYRDYKQE